MNQRWSDRVAASVPHQFDRWAPWLCWGQSMGVHHRFLPAPGDWGL